MNESLSPGHRDSVVYGVDVDAVAQAVRMCPGVADLMSGPGQVATYLPGRCVEGIRVGPDTMVIQVRGQWGIPATTVAYQIRRCVVPLITHHHIDIVLSDITSPETT